MTLLPTCHIGEDDGFCHTHERPDFVCAAIAEERKACAEIADAIADDGGERRQVQLAAREIAGAILARK